MEKVSLAAGFEKITEPWRPRVAASLNGQEVKLVKLHGAFVWHHHVAEDELFLVMGGHLRMEFRDRAVELGPGELIVVPRGVEHRPVSEQGAEVLLFEPANVLNTGNVTDAAYTAPMGQTL